MRVEPCETPPFALQRPRFIQPRFRNGLKFEDKVLKALSSLEGFAPKPWFQVLQYDDWKLFQPDGLLFQPREGILSIIECKYSHCIDAYRQLVNYKKYLECLYPRRLWTIHLVEIVKVFDPFIVFPVKLQRIESLYESTPGTVSVLRFD